jgi:DNA invertase Pin-like site-specific DNA recombinase
LSLEVTTMPLAYSYIRFSRLEQKRGDSIRRQTALRDEYVARKKLQLDTSFVLSDQGLSAFRGRNKRTGALKLFLDAVGCNKIKKGSILIIESLDRLSREQVEEAFDLFLSIIRSGIVLVTLVPEMEYTKGNLGLSQMVLALAEFTRAHGESLIKSVRSRQHWKNQREAGVKGRLTYVLP